VIVAAALGIFLIAKSFDTASSTKTSTGSTTTTSTHSATTVVGGSTTPLTSGPGSSVGSSSSVPTTNVKVLVLNASGVTGAAGKLATTLNGAGFTASKGTANQQRATTVIYYVTGAKAEALSVAAVMNMGADAVSLMPQPPPVDAKTLADNKVVVMLGKDKA